MSQSITATPVPLGGQAGGQVDGHRGLADPAFAGGDGQHPGGRVVAPEGDLLLLLGRAEAAQAGHHVAWRWSSVITPRSDLDPGDPGQRGHGGSDVLGDPVLQRAAGDGEQHLDGDQPARSMEASRIPCPGR